MNVSRFFLVAVISLLGVSLQAQELNLIPKPAKTQMKGGSLELSSLAVVSRLSPEINREYAYWLNEHLGRYFQGCEDDSYIDQAGQKIVLAIDPSSVSNPEGYKLVVGEKDIEITGHDEQGVFYGIQTFLQMLPPIVYDKHARDGEAVSLTIPCVEIEDYPRYPYRGFMLDVARTFSDKQTVKRLLESMAYHKLNKFHWHLTDDEGWRIEIKSYPKLAQVAGFRGGDSPVKHMYGGWNYKQGGYFTQEDIKEVVEYASFLKIEVIPEIDLPGHSRAAARVYPEILCRGEVDTTAANYDMRKVWCVAHEPNYAMLDSILMEVASLFPSPYIYLGGDEVPPEQWEACGDCMALKKRNNYNHTSELTGYFMQRASEIIESYGKSPVVWNEAIEHGQMSKQNTVVHGWESVDKVKEAAGAGYKTVAMPAQYLYFDMKQSSKEPGLTWAGVVELSKTYSFEVDKLGFTTQQKNNIIGVEGALFTELMLSQGPWYLEYQIFPRLCALSEVAWTPAPLRDFNDFNARLQGHYKRLDSMGIKYRSPSTVRVVTPPSYKNASQVGASYKVTSNIADMPKQKYSNASDNNARTYAKTVRSAREGDWFLYKFDRPVKSKSIILRTGYNFLPRYNVALADVRVSYNGIDFVTVSDNFTGDMVIHPESPVHSIRIDVKGECNGWEAVLLQDLLFE